MTWLRIDDAFFEHEKIEDLSHAAFRLHVGGLCLCARLLTDGRVTEPNLKKIAAAGRIASPKRYAQELVDARLWSLHPRGGWRIKDYLHYNPSSEQVKESRRKAAERQAKWRGNHARSNGVTNASPSPTPVSKELPTTLIPKDVTSTEDVERVHGLIEDVQNSFRSVQP